MKFLHFYLGESRIESFFFLLHHSIFILVLQFHCFSIHALVFPWLLLLEAAQSLYRNESPRTKGELQAFNLQITGNSNWWKIKVIEKMNLYIKILQKDCILCWLLYLHKLFSHSLCSSQSGTPFVASTWVIHPVCISKTLQTQVAGRVPKKVCAQSLTPFWQPQL